MTLRRKKNVGLFQMFGFLHSLKSAIHKLRNTKVVQHTPNSLRIFGDISNITTVILLIFHLRKTMTDDVRAIARARVTHFMC